MQRTAIAECCEGGQVIPFAGDVSDEAAARECVETAVAKYGKLDVLINNAGVLLANAETDDMPVDIFDDQIRSNVRSAFLMTRYAFLISAGHAAISSARAQRLGCMASLGPPRTGAFVTGVLWEASTPPVPTLDLRHSHDGTRSKRVAKIPKVTA